MKIELRIWACGAILLMAVSATSQNSLLIPESVTSTNVTLHLAPGVHDFGSGIVANSYGANGPILGPTLIVEQGQTVNWSVFNGLEESTTMHWHGMHVSPANDGGPHSIIDPGETWEPTFEVLDEAGTYWYHPHLHMMTDMHVSKGIAGMIWVRDEQELALPLPRTYGIDEFPIILQTKAFNSEGEIMAHSNSDTLLCVNATYDASLSVPACVIRLHLLNGSSQRAFHVGLSEDLPFHLMATDGGLLPSSLELDRLRLAPGERAEILVDCSGLEGQTLSLMSYASEFSNGVYGGTYPGMGFGQQLTGYNPNPMNGGNFQLLELTVDAPLNEEAVFEIPSTLDPSNSNPFLQAEANVQRNLTMSPVSMGSNALNGEFVFNGAPFDMDVINYTIPLNNIEIWNITNSSPIGHPFHIHDVQFYLIERNGVTPPAEEMGRRDVVFIPAMQSAKFICQFSDFADDVIPYMYHCHMLVHEDGGMMGQFKVVAPQSVSSEEEIGLSMHPNPGRDFLTVEGTSEGMKVQLFDIYGRMVLEQMGSPSSTTLNASALAQGTYTCRLLSADGRSVRQSHWMKFP
jgi:blue copper oxidase